MAETKCAVVTGASSNIGQGIAIVLAEYGYDVAITYASNKEGAEYTKSEVEKLGRRCFVYQAYLQEKDKAAEIVDQAHKDLGRIDVMVNNAGHGHPGSVIAVEPWEIDEVYELDYRAYMLGAGAAARHMIRDGIKGNIIFISSTQGEQAYPANFIYNGMKAAINHSCECIALDLSHYGIRVNVVSPGATWPERADRPSRNGSDFVQKSIPLHRVGTARDNGEAVAFLVSEKASYITGVILKVDGGLILPGLLEGNDEIPWARQGYWEAQYEKAFGKKPEA